jgi:hypothetical protein
MGAKEVTVVAAFTVMVAGRVWDQAADPRVNRPRAKAKRLKWMGRKKSTESSVMK